LSIVDLCFLTPVIKRLKEAAADSTMVIVTHRTSLLELVDRVIVIEDGKVGADGPKSLLARHAPKTGSKQGRQANVAAS
jgi:ATP-binding cassette subfamily C protein LapB